MHSAAGPTNNTPFQPATGPSCRMEARRRRGKGLSGPIIASFQRSRAGSDDRGTDRATAAWELEVAGSRGPDAGRGDSRDDTARPVTYLPRVHSNLDRSVASLPPIDAAGRPVGAAASSRPSLRPPRVHFPSAEPGSASPHASGRDAWAMPPSVAHGPASGALSASASLPLLPGAAGPIDGSGWAHDAHFRVQRTGPIPGAPARVVRLPVPAPEPPGSPSHPWTPRSATMGAGPSPARAQRSATAAAEQRNRRHRALAARAARTAIPGQRSGRIGRSKSPSTTPAPASASAASASASASMRAGTAATAATSASRGSAWGASGWSGGERRLRGVVGQYMEAMGLRRPRLPEQLIHGDELPLRVRPGGWGALRARMA